MLRLATSDGAVSRRRPALAATSVVLAAVALTACSSPAGPTPKTSTVQRDTVSLGVTAPGSLTAMAEQNLGFATSGQLTAVDVKVGDKVQAGQPLATIDDFAARQALATQQAQLAAQQATLSRLQASPTVSGAQDSRDQAGNVLDATRKVASETLDADDVSIDNAEKQLSVDKKAKSRADDNEDDACSGDQPAAYVVTKHTDPWTTPTGSPTTGSPTTGSPTPTSPPTTGSTGSPPAAASSSACPTAQSAATAAKQKVVADQAALDSARQKRDVDRASGELSVQNSQTGVVTTQNNLDSSSSDRPFVIQAQQQAVTSAQVAVDQAQRNVDNTTLKAPVSGTVSVINGTVGEFLAASTGTSSLAPGSTATIPGAGGASGGGSAAAAATGAGASRPGGTQFLVIDNVDQFQVVAPFNESDASAIAANQKVTVTFDAVPDLTVPATVVSVAPTGTSIAGVISYYVTVALDTSDPRLRSGQTANVDVVTSESPNVLTVPSSAVRKQDGQSVVSVIGPGGPTTVPFQPGIVGLDRTEVVSGLQEGQQVLLPVGQ